MEQAIRLYYRGETAKAEAILKKILRDRPNNLNALIRYAAVLTDLGKIEDVGEIYLKIAQIYENEGNYEECLCFLEKCSYFNLQIKISSEKGRCLFRLGRFAEALGEFIVSPRTEENLFYLGKIYSLLNQQNNALRTFREIISNASNTRVFFRAFYWTGKTLLALNKTDEAVECFKAYLAYCPNEKHVHLDLGICYLNLGDLPEAREYFNYFIKSGGDTDIANLYLGIINYRQKKYPEAIKRLKSISPGHQSFHWMGLAYYELAEYEEALHHFSSAANFKALPLYYKMMGNCNLKLGQYFEAKMCYEKALNLDPYDENIIKLTTLSMHFLRLQEDDETYKPNYN